MTSKNSTFLANVDTDKVSQILADADENSKYFTNITNVVVDKYTEDLDNLMSEIHTLVNSKQQLDGVTLERLTLQLSNMLYYIGERAEIIGIKADVTAAARAEVYNTTYLNNQEKDFDRKNKTTVAENAAVAEEASKYESVITSIYKRVYKIVNYRIDAANEMLSVLKKILTKRMQEMDLAKFQSSVGINNAAFNTDYEDIDRDIDKEF